ncbi:uncharacterized protein Z518_04002 [Rhinocladiella mackenziei CBS 650.93]|uniref:Rhinocladiella mackenziei CBS 650.93 unplaced genomic scaffold supercont1.3, whole genome shotgun sequence n=1 Tax=Rhinocladiella mackenziei CBS 650.93 TaxID=1442369 RepID=A0A0D2H6N0_9EURO|nr:uncharacterized protein Z518_04002 [Rhinocladiella mackenziei CBS 650.93]KIX06028.1 hypothetical protein Z518_04002 [Rhinocladiella mackenziei CBS 650.93]
MAPQGIALPLEGGCDCGEIRYAMETKPMVVHCCHCRWCQKETGASFALNAMIETDRLKILKKEPEWIIVPSESGAGQTIARCPQCRIAVWSVYLHNTAFVQQRLRIVRVGTLDNPDALPPDVHIWTAEKQPWIVLSDQIPAFRDMEYDDEKVWPRDGLERRKKLKELEDAQ